VITTGANKISDADVIMVVTETAAVADTKNSICIYNKSRSNNW
jgi:hypothetical protein